jgi:hypothetical protein
VERNFSHTAKASSMENSNFNTQANVTRVVYKCPLQGGPRQQFEDSFFTAPLCLFLPKKKISDV